MNATFPVLTMADGNGRCASVDTFSRLLGLHSLSSSQCIGGCCVDGLCVCHESFVGANCEFKIGCGVGTFEGSSASFDVDVCTTTQRVQEGITRCSCSGMCSSLSQCGIAVLLFQFQTISFSLTPAEEVIQAWYLVLICGFTYAAIACVAAFFDSRTLYTRLPPWWLQTAPHYTLSKYCTLLVLTRTSLLRLWFTTPEYIPHTRLQNVHLILCSLMSNLALIMLFFKGRECSSLVGIISTAASLGTSVLMYICRRLFRQALFGRAGQAYDHLRRERRLAYPDDMFVGRQSAHTQGQHLRILSQRLGMKRQASTSALVHSLAQVDLHLPQLTVDTKNDGNSLDLGFVDESGDFVAALHISRILYRWPGSDAPLFRVSYRHPSRKPSAEHKQRVCHGVGEVSPSPFSPEQSWRLVVAWGISSSVLAVAFVFVVEQVVASGRPLQAELQVSGIGRAEWANRVMTSFGFSCFQAHATLPLDARQAARHGHSHATHTFICTRTRAHVRLHALTPAHTPPSAPWAYRTRVTFYTRATSPTPTATVILPSRPAKGALLPRHTPAIPESCRTQAQCSLRSLHFATQ